MAGRIPENFVKDLIQRVDIVQIIESRIALTKAGREYKACCPFHDEKTPSFYVNPDKQFYHCFGCKKSGTAISFLMDYEHLIFTDAVEELAKFAGIEVPYEGGTFRQDSDFAQMLEIMKKASAAYQHELHHGQDAQAPQAYMESRNINSDTERKYGLGYAPNSWDFLARGIGKKKEQHNLLVKTGMIMQSKEKNRIYDRFRDRLMFPILDRRGRVIAFGGRILDKGEPKYMNSPEMPLFKKGNELFGLYQALGSIRKNQRVLVVEGYTDVLSLSQYGVDYAVATLGTATTSNHIRTLFRLAPEISFCFDGDEAGNNAAWKALEAVLPMMQDGKVVSFVFLPHGHDPDSLIRDEGVHGFEQRITEGESIENVIFDRLQANTNLSRLDGKARLVEEFRKIFVNLPEGAFRDLMAAEVASLTKMDKNALMERLNRGEKPSAGHRQNIPAKEVASSNLIVRQALAMIVQNPQIGLSVQNWKQLTLSKDETVQLLVDVLEEVHLNPDIDSSAVLLEHFRDAPQYDNLLQFVSFEHRILGDDLENQLLGFISKIEDVERREEIRRISQLENLSQEQEDQLLQMIAPDAINSSRTIH